MDQRRTAYHRPKPRYKDLPSFFKSEGPSSTSKLKFARKKIKHKAAITQPDRRLSYGIFVGLSLDVLSRICRYLHPMDLLRLSRTNRELRKLFMSRKSATLWDASRSTTGIPSCTSISYPQVTSFVYENECEGRGCDQARDIFSFRLFRQFCNECALNNLLSLEEVLQQYPQIPEKLVKLLPWTPIRAGPSVEHPDIVKGFFRLRSDVIKLQRQIQNLLPLDEDALALLEKDMKALRNQRNFEKVVVGTWLNRTTRNSAIQRDNRWPIVAAAMKKRWGWKVVEYDELEGNMKDIVEHLVSVPELTEQVWNTARGKILKVIREQQKPPTSETEKSRPFSL